MSQLPIIELCISLVLIFFVLSVMVSAIGEVINTVLQRRSKLLMEAIQKAFDQGKNIPWGTLLYKHPLVANLKRAENRLPSYISSSTFASALISTILEKHWKKNNRTVGLLNPEKSYEELSQAVTGLEEGKVKELLTSFINESADLEGFRTKLCKWYDEYMERVTGWFTRKTKIIIAMISAVVVIAFNVDTIHISKELWNNEALRSSLVMQAEKTVANQELAGQLKEYSEIFKNDTTGANGSAWEELKTKVDSLIVLNDQVSTLKLPIGWHGLVLKNNPYPSGFWSFMQILLGWIISAFALTAGAPFWFRTLSKLVNLRNSGALPPTESKQKT